jgi:putative holliday junction resolvase
VFRQAVRRRAPLVERAVRALKLGYRQGPPFLYARKQMRRMGIDPGLRRVGLALSDEDGYLATPYKTLERTSDAALITALAREAKEREVSEIVVGLPLRLNGSEGPEAKRARVLRRALAQASGLPIVLWDERLTSVAAERELRGVGLKGARKKAVLDQAAATLLLQSYLDAKR